MKAIQSIHLEGTYSGQGYEMPHHILTDVQQITKRFNPHLDKWETVKVPYRDPDNPHCWLNSEHSGFPDGIEHGTKVRFWASYFPRKGGQRLTECREIEIIEEAGQE